MTKSLEVPIKLFLIDIDGCLNSSSVGAPLNLLDLHKLQEISLRAPNDPTIPFFTINTGRYLNYAEVFAQILVIDHFFVFEMGNAIGRCYGPMVEVKNPPQLTEKQIENNLKFQRAFLKEYPQYNEYFQKYKQFSTTFIIENKPNLIEQCAHDLNHEIKQNGYDFLVDVGHNFINLLHKGIDKGTGLHFLLEQYPDIEPENVAGIGDSNSDWDFLQYLGFKACPANGSELLQSKCDFVAEKNDVKGTLEIVQKVIELNSDLLKQ